MSQRTVIKTDERRREGARRWTMMILTLLCAVSPAGPAQADPPAASALDDTWFLNTHLDLGGPLALLQDEDAVDQSASDDVPEAAVGKDYDGDGDVDQGDLAKATQNPIADLISLPFQNNLNFPYGPGDNVQWVLNIQPVVPFNLNEDWNVVTRSILPVINQPSPASGVSSEAGLGDFQFTAWFSPTKPGEWVWGVGPVLRFPTASDETLGSEKWSAGPSLVVLRMDGPWVYGMLVQNLWSYAGDDDRRSVNEFLLQYFVNYNLPDGWYLVSSPINTANWNADSGDRWVIPVGGGLGKVFRIGKQPINAQAQAFYNVERPGGGPNWQVRLQLQLLFPK